MAQDEVLVIFRESIWLILKLVLPLLLVSVVIGLIIAIFQAATQIHEQTVAFAPKVFAIGLMLVVTGSWMLSNLIDFFKYLMSVMAGL